MIQQTTHLFEELFGGDSSYLCGGGEKYIWKLAKLPPPDMQLKDGCGDITLVKLRF